MSDQLQSLIEDVKRVVRRAESATFDAEDAASALRAAVEDLETMVNPSKAAAKEATANGDVYRTAEAIHNAHGGAGPAHYCPWPGCVAFRDFAPPTHVAVVA